MRRIGSGGSEIEQKIFDTRLVYAKFVCAARKITVAVLYAVILPTAYIADIKIVLFFKDIFAADGAFDIF